MTKCGVHIANYMMFCSILYVSKLYDVLITIPMSKIVLHVSVCIGHQIQIGGISCLHWVYLLERHQNLPISP